MYKPESAVIKASHKTSSNQQNVDTIVQKFHLSIQHTAMARHFNLQIIASSRRRDSEFTRQYPSPCASSWGGIRSKLHRCSSGSARVCTSLPVLPCVVELVDSPTEEELDHREDALQHEGHDFSQGPPPERQEIDD